MDNPSLGWYTLLLSNLLTISKLPSKLPKGNRMKDWNPSEIQEALDLELHPVEGEKPKSPEDVARKQMIESVPMAMQSIMHVAFYGESEANRLKASQYLVDKVLGRTTDMPIGHADKKQALDRFLEGVVTHSSGN